MLEGQVIRAQHCCAYMYYHHVAIYCNMLHKVKFLSTLHNMLLQITLVVLCAKAMQHCKDACSCKEYLEKVVVTVIELIVYENKFL